MPQTNADILARSFFDLAQKVEDIAGSDVAQSVPTFGNDDYASIVATLLDAAYWILASQLDDDFEQGPIGADFYTSSSVYNDLIYRGYSPGWAWSESGMSDLFGEAPDAHRPDKGSGLPSAPGGTKPVQASDLSNGDYVVVYLDGGIRVGMMISTKNMFCFDGQTESIVGHKVIKIPAANAMEMLDKFADHIAESQEHRVERETPE